MAQAQTLDSLRGIDVPEGLEIEEIVAWGDRLWARCRVNGYVCRAETGSWMRVILTPLKVKKTEPQAESEPPSEPSADVAAPQTQESEA